MCCSSTRWVFSTNTPKTGAFRVCWRKIILGGLIAAAIFGLGPQAQAAICWWNVSGGTNNWSIATNWLSGTVPQAAGDTANLTYNIAANTTVNLNQAESVGTLNIGALLSGTNSYTLSGTNALTFDNGGAAATAQLNELGTPTGDTIAVPLQLNSNLSITNAYTTLTLSGSIAGSGANITISGPGSTVISGNIATGAGSLTFSAGLLTLSGSNSLTGGITLNSGVLQASTNALALGGGNNALALAGGMLQLTDSTGLSWGNNTTVTNNSIIFLNRGTSPAGAGVTGTLGTLGIGGQTLTVIGGGGTNSGTVGLTFGNTTLSGNTAFYVQNRTNGGAATLLTLGVLSAGGGNDNIIKLGNGNLTFSGSVGNGSGTFTQYFSGNQPTDGTTTFSGPDSGTGAMYVNGGTVVLTGSSTMLASSDVEFLGGTLTIGAGAADGNYQRFTPSTALTLGGGRVNINAGAAATTGADTIASLTLKAGESAFTGAPTNGTYTLTISSSSVNRAVGSIVNFSNGAKFPIKFASQPALTGGTSAGAGGIIGGWATYGTDFASVTGGTIGSVTYDANNSINTYGTNSTISQTLSSTVTLAASETINALKLTSSTGSTYAPLNLNGQTLTIATGGLIANTSAAGNHLAITNGTLTAGSATGAELFVIQEGNTAQTDIAATIADNPGGSINLVRGSEQNANFYLSGENTYTGKTVLAVRNDIRTSGYGITGAQAYTYILTERQLGAMPTPGSGTADKMLLNNSSLVFASNVNPSWAPERGITLGGLGGTINPGSATTGGSTGYNLNLAAPISGTGPLFIYNVNGGEVILSNNASTFDGQVTECLPNSALDFTSIGNIGQPSALGDPSNAANGLIRHSSNNGAVQYVGITAASSNRDFLTDEGGNGSIAASGAGVLTLSGNIYISPGVNNNGSNALAGTGFGILSGNMLQTDSSVNSGLTKNGAGTWRLSGQNNYTGQTVVSGGVLEFTTIGNVGSGPSSLAAPVNSASGTITINTNNTLRFAGSTSQTSNRIVALSNSNNTYNYYVDASGTGGAVLNLTSGISNTSTSSTQTLNLLGTGLAVVSGNISSLGATTNITKAGSGTWTFNPPTANANFGTTRINGGVLVLDFSNLAPPTNLINSTSPLTLGGGNFTLQGKSGQAVAQTMGAFTLAGNSGSVITLNAGAASSVALTTGAVTRNTGSTVDVETTGTTTLTTGAIGLTNGLLPYATYNGNNFATGVATGGAISAFSSYTGSLPLTGGANADTRTLSGGQTQSGNVALTALKITATANNQSLALGGYTLGSGNGNMVGILYDGTSNNYTYTISGNSTVGTGGQELIVHVAAGTLNIGANLGNTSSTFDKAGVGTLILSGNNTASTFTGATNADYGVLQAGSTTAFSPYSSFSVNQNATLALAGYSNTVGVLLGTGVVTNGPAASAPATLTIQTNLQTNLSTNGGYTDDGTYAFNGLITDGGSQPLSLSKIGGGMQYINNVNATSNLVSNLGSSFTGGVSILDGSLVVPVLTDSGVSGPLGAGSTFTLGGGSSGASAGREGVLVYTNHNGETNRTINLPAGSAGGFELTDTGNGGASNMFGATLTLTGQVTGGGALDKLESGNLILANTTNNYTGGSIVRGGILQFASSSAMPSTGTISVFNGGTVAAGWANGAAAILSQLSTSSVGVLALGNNDASNLNFTNYPGVSLGANSQAQSFLGSLTPNGGIYRLGGGGVSSSLMIQNAATLSGTNSVVVSNAGSGGGTVVFSDAQTYSGSTTVAGNPYMVTTLSVPTATLILAGQNATIANSTGINLNASGVLRIVDSIGAAAKLNSSAPLNFNGGTLQYYNDGSTGAFAQSTGTTYVNRGANYVAVNASAGTSAILTFAGLSRTAGATIDFGTTNTGTQQVVIGGAPTLAHGPRGATGPASQR